MQNRPRARERHSALDKT